VSRPLPRVSEPARHIIVADQDPAVVTFIVETLRDEGHAVFHAYDALSAVKLARSVEPCDLVLTNTKITGVDGVDLIAQLRRDRPRLPIIYLANIGRSTPEMEAHLPPDVPILTVPCTAEELRCAVARLLE
jgi:CheY-like chemotaxis protein